MQSGQPACGSSSGFGLVGRGHGERVFIIAGNGNYRLAIGIWRLQSFKQDVEHYLAETKSKLKPPLVAIVGRPNVGKSTLLNSLTGSSRAIVDEGRVVTDERL